MNPDETQLLARHHLRQLGLEMRKVELQRDMQYVLKRDDILRKQGLGPVIDAYDYEQRKMLSSVANYQSSITPKQNSPNGDRVAKLLEIMPVAEIVEKLIENYNTGDYPPMFPDIAQGDPKNSEMRALTEKFEAELVKFGLQFLREHASSITPKALIEFAKTDTAPLSFNQMFRTLNLK